MSYEIRADYEKRWLFPPALDDWVSADHPARFTREFVEALDLRELGFQQRTAVDGRPSYASDLLLKIWLYGYFNRIIHSRQLEAACHNHVGMMWLAGLEHPDHNTLWRFWRDNRGSMRKLFKAVVRLAHSKGLVDLVVHAVDGTKLSAAGSREGVRTRQSLEGELATLDQAVEEVIKKIEESGERDCEGRGYELPGNWREQMLRREEIRELLGEIEASERGTIHEGEREAHLMKTHAAGIVPGYNAQAVVDGGSGLIVAEDVVTDESDNHQLVSMLEEVEENLGQVAAETVADGGYHSGKELERCEDREFGVLVNQGKHAEPGEGCSSEFHKVHFRYDAERDCCVCPRGKVLRLLRQRIRKGGHGGLPEDVRIYHCTEYQTCPVRWSCSREARGRTVSIGRHHAAVVRQREKQKDPTKGALLKLRGQIVERVFGYIKAALGFRRFTVAGLEQVRAQWALICTTFNLRKLFELWRSGALRWAA